MPSPFRIAILSCDTPIDAVCKKHGDYGAIFTRMLENSAQALNHEAPPPLEIRTWDVVDGNEYPAFESVDGVVITGAKYDSYKDIPWINRLTDYTSAILAQDRVRLLGICFGHQIVGRALGAPVGVSDHGWEVAVTETTMTAQAKELFGLQGDKLRLYQFHRDVVYEMPPNVVPLGSTAKCGVHGMYSPGRFITVQGHPEFNQDIVEEMLHYRRSTGVFNEEDYQRYLAAAKLEQDGPTIAKKMTEFLLGD